MITNLLDLNTDILNIIGDYVKTDRMEKEKKEVFEHVNKLMQDANKRVDKIKDS
jgi:hypothetical protein